MEDGPRIFNQDETSLCPGMLSKYSFVFHIYIHSLPGVQHQKVLAPRGYDGPILNKGGDPKLHITASFTVAADGQYVGVRLVYTGKRNRHSHLRDIPSTGVAGQWQSSVSPNGYVTREVFLEILQDLDDHLTRNKVKRPVILFIDGYAGHLGPDISDFCKEHDIRLRLLRYFFLFFHSLFFLLYIICILIFNIK